MEYFAVYDSPLGPLVLVSDGQNLTGLYMNREIPENTADLPVFRQTVLWLEDYFRGMFRPVDVPIRVCGTEFQQRMWKILQTIPPGSVRTYGDIAREIAAALGKERMSAQAVGQAAHRNPVSILIPCHRCVGAGGKLTGYAGGTANKQWLIEHEKCNKKE